MFADLGLHNAEEKQTKVRLAVAINESIRGQQLSRGPHSRVRGLDLSEVVAKQQVVISRVIFLVACPLPPIHDQRGFSTTREKCEWY